MNKAKLYISNVYQYLKKFYLKFKDTVNIFLIAFVINIIIEALSARTVFGGFATFAHNPVVFLYNTLIIMFTLSIANFIPKKFAGYLIISSLWLALGIINYSIRSYRLTPLSATDFEILSSVWTIIDVYLKSWQVAAITVIFCAIVALLVYRFIKGKKVKVNFKYALINFAGMGAALALLTTTLLNTGAISTTIGNLVIAYREYGFVFCFSASVVDRGIDMPKEYSTKTVDEIREMIGQTSNEPKMEPNIIMVQLESFFDANYMKDLTYSENPVPEFTKLKENYSHGFLTVPSFGAGTANTEFEVITGMNIGYFGAGEYPYKTVLKNKTCETVNYNLMQLGYKTHAIHNHSASFYSRYLVYPNMGFDTFTSLEYMENTEKNPIGWAKDHVLIEEIQKAVNSDEERDFVYAVSVQPHGKYPSVMPEGYEAKITAAGFKNPANEIPFTYYLNQLNETDKFVGDLCDAFKKSKEPTIIVFYGDHLPNVEMTADMLKNNDLYQTEYVIWSNFEMEKQEKNLCAYQLAAYTLGRVGINNGILTKLHQNFSENANYQKILETLEYDMLYGDMESYENAIPYKPVDMRFGIDDIKIKSVRQFGSYMYVTGEHFTRHSKVVLDGKRKKTVYINANTLLIEHDPEQVYQTVCVTQYGNNGDPLTSTDTLQNPDTLAQLFEQQPGETDEQQQNSTLVED